MRVFTNVRTATRNLDLPLAIRDPRSSGSPYVPKGGFGPVHFCHNGGLSVAWGPLLGRNAARLTPQRYSVGRKTAGLALSGMAAILHDQ